MPRGEDHRIFISYAHRDGAALAERLQQDLTASGFDAWLDKQRLVAGAVWTAEIEREIDTRPVTLALLTPGSYESEICRAEQLRALRKGKRLIPLLAAPGADRPLHLEARQYRDFTDHGGYAARFQELVADIRGGVGATLRESYRETRVTYLTAPARVANYLERPEALRALRDTLFAEDRRQPIALTALSGMGGIGKTVLAQALTRDEVVRQAFPDGIVWITAGRERRRDFVEEMREVAKALGDDLSRYENALACENQYRTTIANKAALIVVDDVWSKADLEPLLAESPRSRFLFTTRDASIGRFVGARQHTADLLDVAQSRELLAGWAHLAVARLPAEADALIGECGRLPLALAVVGAMLRGAGAKFWTDTLDLLRKVDLSAIQEQLPQRQDSFFKAVEVSFQALAPEMQERYKALAVLLEDMPAPLSVLQTLWNATEAEARRVSRHLVDRSLAQADEKPDGAQEAVRLHDLQLDYVRAQHPDRDALSLVQGAVRLSANVISTDPAQFASQVVGRLLPHQGVPAIERFTAKVAKGAPGPWIRPLKPALHPPGGSLIRTLEGHTDPVCGVALTPDGRRAVSSSSDRTLKMWDLETGRELHTLEGHCAPVNCVAVSPDGRRVVSASWDQTVKVWDSESGRELYALEGHSAAVEGVAVSPDERRVVTACYDGMLKVWDLQTGRELRTLTGHLERIQCVVLSPDGRRAISASDDCTLKVWDLETGRELRTLEGHSDHVWGVAVTPDGRRVVSTSADKDLKVWDLETGRELRTLEGHSGSVNGVAVTPDGRRAVSASSDKTLKVWDLETGRKLRTLAGHSDWVISVATSPNGRLAVSTSEDETVKVWDLRTGRGLGTLEGHSGRVHSVAVSLDGRRMVSASDDHTLKVWDLKNGRVLRTLKGHSGCVHGVAVSTDGRQAISASWDKTLKVWDLNTGRELCTLGGHSDWVFGVAVSPVGRWAVSASRDRTLKVWDLETGCELRTLEGHRSFVTSVAVGPDGRRGVSASWDTTVKVWDLETGRDLRTVEIHADTVEGVAVSPDGHRVASASSDKTLKVWDLETGAVHATFTCDAPASSCAFINDRKLIAGDALGRVHFLCLEESKRKR